MAERDSMLFWLAEAAKQAREAADRMIVHVAASANMGQSSMWRFEQKREAWPRNPDAVVAAYADDLDIDNFALWETAMQLWREDREKAPRQITEAMESAAARGKKGAGGSRRQPATRRPA